jgi:hypothetical protein
MLRLSRENTTPLLRGTPLKIGEEFDVDILRRPCRASLRYAEDASPPLRGTPPKEGSLMLISCDAHVGRLYGLWNIPPRHLVAPHLK